VAPTVLPLLHPFFRHHRKSHVVHQNPHLDVNSTMGSATKAVVAVIGEGWGPRARLDGWVWMVWGHGVGALVSTWKLNVERTRGRVVAAGIHLRF
jgi:hypothetical protein